MLTLLMIIGVAGGVQAAGYLIERSDIAALQSRSAALLDLQDLVHELEESIATQHDSVTAFLLSGRLDALAGYRVARTKEAELFGSSTAIVARFPEVAAELQAIQDAADAWREQSLDPTVALVQTGRVEEARSAWNLDAGGASFQKTLAADGAFDRHVASLSADVVTDMDRIEGNQATAFLLSLVGALLGVLAAIWLLSRRGMPPPPGT